MVNDIPLPAALLEYYEDPYHQGECERATHVAELSEPGIGVVVVQLRIIDDEIEEAWFDGDANEWALAVTSKLMESIEQECSLELGELSPEQLYLRVVSEVPSSAEANCRFAANVLIAALKSGDNDDWDGPTFSGPSLGEES